jgi:transcriptional regulator with PAS, ATPase and Fis domain
MDRYARRYNRPARQLSGGLAALFQSYEWPGNIRELENMISSRLADVAKAAALKAERAIIEDTLNGAHWAPPSSSV